MGNNSDLDFEPCVSGEPFLITQPEVNDSEQDLGFSKANAEFLASRLQGWHLLIPDVVYSSNIIPKILVSLIFDDRAISYVGCATQLFFYCFLGSTECILFAVMAYDRYMAICHPLNYNLIMQPHTCLRLVLMAYIPGFLHSLIEICWTFRLSFCESNVLHHFVCDFPPLLKIACSDTTINEMIIFICSSSIILPCILFILVSYSSIFIIVLKMTAAGGRQKAFSTCSSHITAVILFYGTILSVYVSPKSVFYRQYAYCHHLLYCGITHVKSNNL
ncbi:olfactory receptor 5AP2-like [Anomaloglossus baeobatrachus]